VVVGDWWVVGAGMFVLLGFVTARRIHRRFLLACLAGVAAVVNVADRPKGVLETAQQ